MSLGVESNPSNWHSGHVVLPERRAHVLLVTLNKQGKAADLGIALHLFVRERKLAGVKAAPFVYQGRVRYLRHQDSDPVSGDCGESHPKMGDWSGCNPKSGYHAETATAQGPVTEVSDHNLR